MTKGFITVATGRDEYYRLAHNLLRSYRYFCNAPLPFAILSDRENQWTEDFDDVVLFPEGATNSYLDKLRLAELLPYDENIFIDSDCLAYGDLNRLFDYFDGADDFSCFGRVLPLDDKTGWFEYENLGDLKPQVSYVVGLHGGIYFLRRTEACRGVLATARGLIPDYARFRFKGNFSNPGDEPLVALAMALKGFRPVPFGHEAICCYWEYADHLELDLSRGLARVTKGLGKENEAQQYDVLVLHWGTRFTRELEYKFQEELLGLMEKGAASKELQKCKASYHRQIRARQWSQSLKRARNKLRRILKKQ